MAKTNTVRAYAGEEDIFRQIINLTEKYQDIFLEIFVRIIPFGDFYKKGKAEEISVSCTQGDGMQGIYQKKTLKNWQIISFIF